MPRQPAGPSPTLTEIMEGVGVDWVWLYCTGPTCHHKAPLKLSVAIEQYGPDRIWRNGHSRGEHRWRRATRALRS